MGLIENLARTKENLTFFFNRTWKIMVPYAFCKSKTIVPVERLESKPVSILSVSYEKHESAEWLCRNNICWIIFKIK